MISLSSRLPRLCIVVTIAGVLLLSVATTLDVPPSNPPREVVLRDFRGGSESTRQRCISSLVNCDLRCLDWTIVLALGRSGSTTIQAMISKLPGMNFYGEEGGILKNFRDAQDTIRTNPSSHLSWLGSADKNDTTIACMVQKFFSERHEQTCLERGCRHGWKEIRYLKPEDIRWVRALFPSARIVVNYRDKCANNYVDVFDRNCTRLERQKQIFLQAIEDVIAEDSSSLFHLRTEQLNNLTRWNELSAFLGYNCDAVNVTSANTNRSGTRQGFKYSPWIC